MNKKDIHISLYILVPAIFSGISLLTVIVTYRIISGCMEKGIEPVTQLFWLGGGAILISVVCSYLILALIIEAITRAGGIQTRAAQFLGINPRSLWRRIKKYQIDVATLKKLQDF